MPPPEQPTPRDQRAAAREDRQHLQLPHAQLGRGELARSRSPSPSAPGTFRFPPTATASTSTATVDTEEEQFRDARSTDTMSNLTVDEIVQIATASAKAAAQELAASMRPPPAADPAAAATAATTQASSCVKKVELPPFDKKNIHTWIRRVEAAFGRAGVTTAKDKFFFIESKLDVNISPKVNEFLCGDSTDDTWDNFLSHLQEEYGKTKEQQASQFLRGIPRDNLRPTQHLAKIKDTIKDIKLEDLIKEMVLKDLPSSVRQSLAERTNLSAEEAAKAADHHFDKDGRLKHDVETPKINNVNDCPGLVDTEDEADSVNAIGHNRFKGKFNRGGQRKFTPQQKPFTPAFTPQQKSFTPSFQDKPRNQTSYQGRNNERKPLSPQLCRFHAQFGEKAKNCEPGCQFKKQQSNAASGNGAAGRRM